MRVGSLCTGILGAELAFSMMGLKPDLRWYSEIDKDACKLLAARVPGVPNLGDLKVVDWSAVEPIDALVAGFPCQPFSSAGKREGVEDERHLWPYIAAGPIRTLRPGFVFLENVAAFIPLGLGLVLGDLADLGYDARWTCLRASDVGACHGRNRFFLVATDTLRPGGREDAGAVRRHEAEHGGEGSLNRDQPLGDGEAIGSAGTDGQRTPPDPDQGRRGVGSHGGGVR